MNRSIVFISGHTSVYVLQLNGTYETPWVEYNIPTSTRDHPSSHTQEFILHDLMPDTEYMATMQATNVFGASEITEEFLFRTAAGSSNFAAV